MRPISPFLADPKFRRTLRAQWARAVQSRGLKEVQFLVAIPTNDAVISAVIACQPRRLLMVDTGSSTRECWAGCRDYIRADPGLETRAESPPEPGDPVSLGRLVAHIERKLGAVDRSRVVWLVSTGLSSQTAQLTHLAEASGGTVMHIQPPYNEQGEINWSSEERECFVLELPGPVRERYALRRARTLVRGGAPSEAVRSLEALTAPSHLAQATRSWAQAIQHRQALQFQDALDACGRASEALDSASRTSATRALEASLRHLEQALESLVGEVEPLDMAAEQLLLAERAGSLQERNHAALLYYRAGEMLIHTRLERDHGIRAGGGLSTAQRAAIGADFSTWSQRLFGVAREPGYKLGFIDGLICLACLKDKGLSKAAGESGVENFLRRWQRASEARNKSIFAHGFDAVSQDDLETMAALADALGALAPRADWGKARGLHRLQLLSAEGDHLEHT